MDFLLLFAHVILNAASSLFNFFYGFCELFYFFYLAVFFVVVIIYMTEIKHSVQIQVQFHDAYICKILPGVSLVFKLLPWLSQVLSKQGRRIAEHSSYQAGIHQVSCVVDRTNNTNRTADAVTQHLESSCSAPSKLRLLLFNLAGFIYFFLVPTSN